MKHNDLLLAVTIAAVQLSNPPRAPPLHRDLVSLADLLAMNDFRSFFRLTQEEFHAIHHALKLPATFVTSERDRIQSREGLLLVLGYLGGARGPTLAERFGRSPPSCSRLCTHIIEAIHIKWQHLLDVKKAHTGSLSPERLRRYVAALEAQQCPLKGLWGFLDGTVRPIARPSRGHREAYNGHKRQHGYKYQILITPDGMMWVDGPVLARRHDSFVLSESDLHGWLNEHSSDDGRDMFIFADKGYAAKDHLVVPHKGLHLTPAQDAFNLQMSRVRIAVEWAIAHRQRHDSVPSP